MVLKRDCRCRPSNQIALPRLPSHATADRFPLTAAEKMSRNICCVQEVGQLGEVWEELHLSLTRSLGRAREERRAQAQLEVIGGKLVLVM